MINQAGTTTWPETTLPCLASSRLKTSTLLATSVLDLLLDALLVALDTLLLLAYAKIDELAKQQRRSSKIQGGRAQQLAC